MKKVDSSFITNTSQQPFTQGTWQHLQQAYQELGNNAIQSLIENLTGQPYSSSTPYILWGCNYSTTGINSNLTEGAIYYNGEIYINPYTSITGVGALSGVYCHITTSYFTATIADPLTFSDGSTHSVHQINTITFNGTSASADFQLINAKRTSAYIQPVDVVRAWGAPETLTFDKSYYIEYSSTRATVNTLTFDFTNAIVGCEVQLRPQGAFVGGSSIAISKPSGCDADWISATTSIAGGGGLYGFKVKYMGKNSAGNDYVTINMYLITAI